MRNTDLFPRVNKYRTSVENVRKAFASAGALPKTHSWQRTKHVKTEVGASVRHTRRTSSPLSVSSCAPQTLRLCLCIASSSAPFEDAKNARSCTHGANELLIRTVSACWKLTAALFWRGVALLDVYRTQQDVDTANIQAEHTKRSAISHRMCLVQDEVRNVRQIFKQEGCRRGDKDFLCSAQEENHKESVAERKTMREACQGRARRSPTLVQKKGDDGRKDMCCNFEAALLLSRYAV